MDARRVNDHITVSSQIGVADVTAIAAAGFKSIICNRPDGESLDQTCYADIAAEALRLGIEIRWQPIVSGLLSDEEGLEFGRIAGTLPSPTFAYCRSGTRCVVLWSLSEAGKRPVGEIIMTARHAGYDLAGLEPRIEALARLTKP